jgi:ESCRT-II complex subunit VPS36
MNRFDPLPSVTLETLSAQLYPDETLISQQDGVGLYDGSVLSLSTLS